MSTVADQHEVTSVITNDAYDLINCIYDGVDEIVYSVAKSIAAERQPNLNTGEPVRIDVDDVRRAGREVINALQTARHNVSIPESLTKMADCFESKSDE